MIEILREPPNSPWVLVLFFIQGLIYILLYKNDPRRLAYFFSSIVDKKYQINYGRHFKSPQNFLIFLGLQTLLTGALIVSSYIRYCSNYSDLSNLFFFSFIVLTVLTFLKFALVYLLGILFNNRRKGEEFLSYSIQYTTLFFTPIVLLSPYLYLSNNFNIKYLLPFICLGLFLYLLSILKLYLHVRNVFSLGVCYYILYICTFELVPLYWLLVCLDC